MMKFGTAVYLVTCAVVASFAHNAIADGIISDDYGNQFSLMSYLGETGLVITRPTHYEYAPVAINIRGEPSTVHIWFCGGGGSSALGGDSIFYATSSDYGQTWSTPLEVIRASNRSDYLDYGHVCDPSVTEYNGYYYIMYTGAPGWGNCTSGGPNGCDNRIFVARVPTHQFSNQSAYQKLVNVGECYAANCFQWQNNSSDVYAPVPIIRSETNSVWRKSGTGTNGTTTKQTDSYGIGQPSQLSVLDLKIWLTINNTENIWSIPYALLTDPYLLQLSTSYTKRASFSGNDVNYDVAFDNDINRYVVTVSRSSDPVSTKPCVHVADNSGPSVYPSMKINFYNQSACHLNYAESNAHNVGFLRDQWGYLAGMSGHANGPLYKWVFYGSNSNLLQSNPERVDIKRIPFNLQ